jgi:hypothetical protein
MEKRAMEVNTNRARMPETAAIVDAFRAAFGPGVAVRWASENGIEVGTKGPAGVPMADLMRRKEWSERQ